MLEVHKVGRDTFLPAQSSRFRAWRQGRCSTIAAALFLVTAFGTATANAVLAQVPERQDFDYCLVCHGSAVGGNKSIGAPNLSNLAPWYLEAQLKAFKAGYRGWHPEDEHGRSMTSAVRDLATPDEIGAAVAFVAAYAPVASPRTVTGDAEHGREIYQACAACHGADGAGIEVLSAPAIAGQNDWYLVKAINDYRSDRRGNHPDDKAGASMRLASQQLADEQAVYDVVAYVGTLGAAAAADTSTSTATSVATSISTGTATAAITATSASDDAMDSNSTNRTSGESEVMKKNNRSTGLAKTLPALALVAASTSVLAHDVTRYPLPGGSTFPIAQAVTVPAGTELTFHSGLLPRPADPDADPSSREFLGDTYTQTMSVLQQFEASLKEKGMGLGNIIKMNVYLVGDPELDGKMDFAGFMRAYSQFFGTEEQPHLPARAAIQIAGLARGAFIEIEVIAAR